MRIKNETNYQTNDLLKFISAGIRAMGCEKNKIVRVASSHQRKHWGCAPYGYKTPSGGWSEGSRLMFSLPSPKDLNLAEFARVVEHEIAHNMGLRHGEMDDNTRYCNGPMPEWAKGLQIRVKEKNRKAKRPIVEVNEERARAALEKWENRLKQAQRFARKWRKRVRYYDRKKAARPSNNR